MRRAVAPIAALAVLCAVSAAFAQEDGPKLTEQEKKFAERMR